MAALNINTRPRIAVSGCGYWGKNLVRNFHQLNALAAVQDTHQPNAKKMADLYDVPICSFDQILSDEDIHGIVIAAPAEQHAQLSEAALRAGKNVFVEKPLALKVPDAQKLCELALEKNLILMVGHLLQYHPAFLKLKDMCHAGTLGNVQYVYSNRLNLGKFRTEENILWSFAPHDISMILGLFGEGLESVSAMGHSYLNHKIPDVTTTHLQFSDGRAAHVFVSWLHPFKEQRLVVVGDGGMAVFDDTRDWTDKITFYPDSVSWENGVPSPLKAEHQAVPIDEAEPLKLECTHFLECIEDGKTPRTDGNEGVRVLRVLDAAQRSIETGATTIF